MAGLLEIEGILEDDRFNDEIHPNRTTKGYVGIHIGLRAAEGEGEMTDEDESTDPGIIVAAERAILKFLNREANEAAPEDPGTSTVNQGSEHPVSANPVKQTKTGEELAAMIHQDFEPDRGLPGARRQGDRLRSQPMELFADIWRRCRPRPQQGRATGLL
jgi:hypothetical protein